MERGDLEETSTAALLRRLADDGATGCLRIDQHGTRAAVWLRNGAVYTATAPMARTRLGDRLVGAGLLTGEQLGVVLSEQQRQRPAPRLGELLIAKHEIDRDTLAAVVRAQIADSVAAALSWTDGTWSFNSGEEVTEDVPLDMSVENLLMEGARRLEEWEIISYQLGSLDVVVDFVGRGREAELSLTPDEWSMLTRIDGSSTVREMADAAGYGQFEAARIIYGLLSAGVVALLDEPDPAPAATTEQEEELPAVEPEPAPVAPPPHMPEPPRRRGLFRRKRT